MTPRQHEDEGGHTPRGHRGLDLNTGAPAKRVESTAR
jgi:hypothetical protein